jgi:hypothetical protein
MSPGEKCLLARGVFLCGAKQYCEASFREFGQLIGVGRDQAKEYLYRLRAQGRVSVQQTENGARIRFFFSGFTYEEKQERFLWLDCNVLAIPSSELPLAAKLVDGCLSMHCSRYKDECYLLNKTIASEIGSKSERNISNLIRSLENQNLWRRIARSGHSNVFRRDLKCRRVKSNSVDRETGGNLAGVNSTAGKGNLAGMSGESFIRHMGNLAPQGGGKLHIEKESLEKRVKLKENNKTCVTGMTGHLEKGCAMSAEESRKWEKIYELWPRKDNRSLALCVMAERFGDDPEAFDLFSRTIPQWIEYYRRIGAQYAKALAKVDQGHLCGFIPDETWRESPPDVFDNRNRRRRPDTARLESIIERGMKQYGIDPQLATSESEHLLVVSEPLTEPTNDEPFTRKNQARALDFKLLFHDWWHNVWVPIRGNHHHIEAGFEWDSHITEENIQDAYECTKSYGASMLCPSPNGYNPKTS